MNIASSAVVVNPPDLNECCSLFLHALIYHDEEPLRRYTHSLEYPTLPKGHGTKNKWFNKLVFKLLTTLREIKYFSPNVMSYEIQQDMRSRLTLLSRKYVTGSFVKTEPMKCFD